MTDKIVDLGDGRSLTLTIPDATSRRKSGFAFGIYKAGSTLLNNIVAASCAQSPYTYYSLNDDCFAQGAEIEAPAKKPSPALVAAAEEIFALPGFMFAGFRRMPRFRIPALADHRKVLLVRDPRDAIVSHFFSVRYSHNAPAGTSVAAQRESLVNEELVEYVQRPNMLQFFNGVYDSYAALPEKNLLTIRYEDYIFDKLALVNAVVDHLGIGSPAAHREELAHNVDVRPDTERASEHIRQVKPGNHVEKLPPDVVARLTAAFAPVLEKFGYT